MSRAEYDLLREQEPWMRLPHWDCFTERVQKNIEAVTVEDAKVRRLAKILGADYVNDRGECVYQKP